MNVFKDTNSEVRGLSEYASDTGIVIVIIRSSALLPTASSGLATENLIDRLWVL